MPAFLLLLLTGLRLVVAAVTPLAPDEGYYWIWSRALAPGYLDHPPMVALWIRLGTLVTGDDALGVRLLGPISAAIGSLMLWDAANRLYPEQRPGVTAAVLLNATLMVGAGSVTMTPDTPLLFFAVLTLWALARVGCDARWWIVAGAGIGLGLESKYTAVLLAIAPVIWIAGLPRWEWLRSAYPWLGAAVAAALFAPVVAWNAGHSWASFAKQGGRAENWVPQQAVQHLLELLGGQIGLATPLIAVLLGAGLWQAWGAARRRDPAGLLLIALVVPGLLLFLEHTVSARVQPNWLAILYPPLAIGAAVAGKTWWRVAAGFGFALTALVYLQAAAAPFPLPRRLDPTLARLAGWTELAAAADRMRRGQGLAFVASDDYGPAAELAWAAPRGAAVIGVEDRWRLFRLPQAQAATGLLLISERRHQRPDPAFWRDTVPIGRVIRARDGLEAEAFQVYRATLVMGAPAVLLPRPGGE
ncbi:MAG: glycosyltransferase family 39 protein [Acetobacteraceae bacterium]|nr:glycosyltransferase family 39 protein [Acetobacteraceae bacterium]